MNKTKIAVLNYHQLPDVGDLVYPGDGSWAMVQRNNIIQQEPVAHPRLSKNWIVTAINGNYPTERHGYNDIPDNNTMCVMVEDPNVILFINREHLVIIKKACA